MESRSGIWSRLATGFHPYPEAMARLASKVGPAVRTLSFPSPRLEFRSWVTSKHQNIETLASSSFT